MTRGRGRDPASRGTDDEQEGLGGKWLAERFGAEVSEPVRFHVAAKRYLCAVEPDYFSKLSPDSVRSLGLQGGPMSADEIASFRRHPQHEEAVRPRPAPAAAHHPPPAPPAARPLPRHVTPPPPP